MRLLAPLLCAHQTVYAGSRRDFSFSVNQIVICADQRKRLALTYACWSFHMAFHIPARLFPCLRLSISHVLSHAFRRSLVRKVLSSALVVSLVVCPGSALTIKQLPMLASTAFEQASSYSGLGAAVVRWLFGVNDTERRETPEERISRVSTLLLSPARIVVYQNQMVTFTATGVDFAGRTIPGLSFTWSLPVLAWWLMRRAELLACNPVSQS